MPNLHAVNPGILIGELVIFFSAFAATFYLAKGRARMVILLILTAAFLATQAWLFH